MNILMNLRKNKRVSKDLEALVANLTLEELIHLKLLISANSMAGTPYGLKIWKSISKIAKDAVFKFAVGQFHSEKASASFLGLNLKDFRALKDKYGLRKIQKVNDYIYNKEGDKI